MRVNETLAGPANSSGAFSCAVKLERMDPPNEKLVEFGKKIAKMGSFRFHALFVMLGVLAGLPLQVVVAWRGTEPGPVELLLRVLLVFACLSVAMAILFWLILRTKVDHE